MAERNLFHAKDADGKTVHIDTLTERSQIFFCPYCADRVVARMGEEKIWHFAHLEAPCHESRAAADDGNNQSLGNFATATEGKIEMSESDTFYCPACKGVSKKVNSAELPSGKRVCKQCFTTMPLEMLNQFM